MKFILVNINPKADTPERLKAMTVENSMDSEQWIFLMKHKKITPLDFPHSNIISVLYRNRILQFLQEGLDVSNKGMVDKIK